MTVRKKPDEDIKELVRTLRGFNGTPGVMERIVAVETGLKALVDKVDLLLEKQAADNNPESPKNPNVTWPWIRDKILSPAIILFFGWFFFSFIPSLIGHLAK